MPTIILTNETYRRLLQRVLSFDDQPEDVIVRLLDEADGGSGSQTLAAGRRRESPTRAAPGSVAPIKAYWIPILKVLAARDGAAHSNEVVDALEAEMAEIFTEHDRLPLQSGETRWRNRARFARLRMKEAGLLSDSSDRGIWEMTPDGERFLRQEEEAR
jgi:hypothetical protein